MFVDSIVDKVTKVTRRSLRQAFWEFDRQFRRQLKSAESKSSDANRLCEKIGFKRRVLLEIQTQSNELYERVLKVSVDEQTEEGNVVG
jgi:hypothetical protein